MSTPSIQTLITQAQQVLNLKSSNEIRATLAAVLANANVGTPLNPNLTTQQLWDEFYEIVRQPTDDIMSIITDQMMRLVFSPPAPGGAGADKQVIFNDGGALAGDSKFLWDKTANRLDIDGPLVVTGKITANTNVDIWNGLNANSTSIGVGATALAATTLGVQNTAVGRSALAGITAGNNNTALGYLAAQSTVASGVTAIGANVLTLSTGGDQNTAVGSGAMSAGIVTGAANSAFGSGSLAALTIGIGNVAIGINAGNTTTNGNGNIFIGANTAGTAAGTSNQLGIGSVGNYVATNGGPTTYFGAPSAGGVALPVTCSGFIQINLNGALVKIPVYPNA